MILNIRIDDDSLAKRVTLEWSETIEGCTVIVERFRALQEAA